MKVFPFVGRSADLSVGYTFLLKANCNLSDCEEVKETHPAVRCDTHTNTHTRTQIRRHLNTHWLTVCFAPIGREPAWFLDASTHLYERECPSLGLSVGTLTHCYWYLENEGKWSRITYHISAMFLFHSFT